MITAIIVSRSCGLIDEKDECIIINEENAKESVEKCISRIQSSDVNRLVIVLSGYLLSQVKGILEMNSKELFRWLCKCKSVICCRVTPKQKVGLDILYFVFLCFVT